MNNIFTNIFIVIKDGKIYILDLAAKLDETALFLCSELWKTRDGHPLEFPAPFGRSLTVEVCYSFRNQVDADARIQFFLIFNI